MKKAIELLSEKLIGELGLVANVVSLGNEEKIIGGTGFDDRDGIGLYLRKYEIWPSERGYRLFLPIGQTFIEKNCGSDVEVMEVIKSHFHTYYPALKVGATAKGR